MGTTTTYGWPYPELTDPPDGAGQIKALANAVDTTVGKGLPIYARPSGGASDWNFTGTTYANVPAMAIPLVANGVYDVTVNLMFYGDQTWDSKWRWTYPVGAGVHFYAAVHYMDVGSTLSTGPFYFFANHSLTSPSPEFYGGCINSVVTAMRWDITHVVGATAGTLQLQGAQMTAGGQSSLLAGSKIRAQRIT